MTGASPDRRGALVLGVGNLLWADEGFGVRCMEAFADAFAPHPDIALVEGGTQGLLLIPYFQAHPDVILFDAVDFGDAPGSMRLVETADIPAFIGARAVSLHQTGMAEVLACANLLGAAPRRALLIGVQPVELEDYGGSLTPLVRAQIDPAVKIAAERLRDWGYALRDADAAAHSLFDGSLKLSAYEQGRPAADLACRGGDARVLARASPQGG